MKHWLKLTIIAVIIAFTNGTHFIKVVILASLGLTGLWLVHTLAQDFNVQSNSNPGAGRFLFKRSIEYNQKPVIDWESVFLQDPADCIKSFLCQSSATKKEHLSKEEQQILQLFRSSAKSEDWAAKQLNEALQEDKKVHPIQCMKKYKNCQFTNKKMLALLKLSDKTL